MKPQITLLAAAMFLFADAALACGQIVYDQYGVPRVTPCGTYQYQPKQHDSQQYIDDWMQRERDAADMYERQRGARDYGVQRYGCELIGGNDAARAECYNSLPKY